MSVGEPFSALHTIFTGFMLAYLAKERNCGRLEWWVLDWNEPAINFYKSLRAKAMDEWPVYRVTGDALHNLANVLYLALRNLSHGH